ncbi:MAG: tRNA lysidine(34) synthetase TilS [Actinomycetota bacterium]
MTICLPPAVVPAVVTDSVAVTVERHRMLTGSEPTLVAFSGGADSTALALVLTDLGYPVVLGHVDHGLRAESAAEADHCRRVAGQLGVDILCRRVTVDPATQAEARRVRYLALDEMAEECGAPRIATGHTQDDQAETVLMRLRRGGYGLGIPPVRDNVIRPLIEVTRSSTERACREVGVEFLNDPSNRDPRYRRAAVRAELAGAGAGEKSRLLGIGDRAAREAGRVALQVDQALTQLVEVDEHELRILRSGLADLEPGVARQFLHRVGRVLGLQLSGRLVDDILRKVPPHTGARLDLPGGYSVWCEPDAIVAGRWPQTPSLDEHELPVGSRTRLPDWGIEVALERVSADAQPDPCEFCEVVDAAAVGSSVILRQWRPGDRFRPLGAPGTKKLQDFFVDAKVPKAGRGTVPIVAAGERIVWVVGYRLDDAARLTRRSTGAVRLSVSRMDRKRRSG